MDAQAFSLRSLAACMAEGEGENEASGTTWPDPSVQIWQFLVINCEIGPRALFSIMEVS